jgi:alkylhydroperoxidase family enzyme
MVLMNARLQPAAEPYAEKVQRVLDRLPRSWMPPFSYFTTLAHHPTLLERVVNGAPSYLPDSHVSVRQREILLLRVTARCGCEYEWGMRVHYFAEDAQLTSAEIAATVHGDAKSWGHQEAILIQLADELHDRCDVSDALWAELRSTFDEQALLELLVMAGYYRTVAYVANGLRLPLEPKVGLPFPKA